jgi:hypothetical protein
MPHQGQGRVLLMTRTFAILGLLIVSGGLAACAAPDRTGGAYVGRFDNDENRRPMLINNTGLIDNTGRNLPAQNLTYGDGEH